MKSSFTLSNYILQISKRNKECTVKNVLSVSNKQGFINQCEQFEDREVASEDKSNYKIVQKTDFAYNPARINVGSLACLTNYDCGIISPMYVCFKTKKTATPSYLYYYFQSTSFKHEMSKRLEGSVRQCLTYENLCNIKVSMPDIPTQIKHETKLLSLEKKVVLESTLLMCMAKEKKYLLKNMFI